LILKLFKDHIYIAEVIEPRMRKNGYKCLIFKDLEEGAVAYLKVFTLKLPEKYKSLN
jgi:hypothetical protein